jgi:DNA-binding CsgD family transcriptional regulator
MLDLAVGARLWRLGERLDQATSIDEGIEVLQMVGEVIGISRPGVVDDISSNHPVRDARGRRLNDQFGWPSESADRWYNHSYLRQYPLYLRSRFETLPFAAIETQMWEDIMPLTFSQQLMRRETKTLGVTAFVVVPVHLPLGRVGVVLWGACQPVDVDDIIARYRYPLLAIGYGFMSLLRRPYQPQIELGDLTALTERQIDCLYWAASGKTVRETAMILAISSHTVREHLRLAMHRLRAGNIAHVVAIAAQFGIIGAVRGRSAPSRIDGVGKVTALHIDGET